MFLCFNYIVLGELLQAAFVEAAVAKLTHVEPALVRGLVSAAGMLTVLLGGGSCSREYPSQNAQI